MSLIHSPRIVTDGLKLVLDAGVPTSWNTGISTNWTDKVGGNNGTIVGGTYHNDGPFVGAGYVEFDGDSDSLTVPASVDFVLDGQFTLEFWIYLNTIILDTQNPSPITFSQNGSNTGQIYLNVSNKFFSLWNGSSNVVTTGNNSVTTGTWYHVAVTRDSSNNCRIFLDGVLKDTASSTFTFGNASGDLRIGSFNGTGGDVNGNISNLRLIKGTALYTSNFTPKRQPLIPESAPNTVLLTCQKGTIRDRSSSAHAITINGNAKSISGASYFEFDGTNAYVSGNLSTLTSWSMCIWYLSTDITSNFVFYPFSCNNAANGLGFGGTFDSTTNGRWYFFDGTNTFSSTNTAVTTNVWYNLVVTKSSTTYNLYTNGSLSLNTSGVDLNCTLYSLGRRGDGLWYAKGNIAQASIYNRALTAAEVSQNFNALRGRYGI